MIIKTNKEIGRLFRRAYGYLAQAKLLNDEIESYYLDGDALDIAGLNRQANILIKGIFNDNLRQKPPKSRHLFASAITPEGLANHFDTLFDSVAKRYIITGEPGTGKSTLVQKIYQAAMVYGFDTEVFHCALDPNRIEHMIIPQLQTAIITSNTSHPYSPKADDTVLNTEMFINRSAVKVYAEDLDKAQDLYGDSIKRAIGFIARAKKAHDDLESYYIPYMDFPSLNKRRDSILQRIMNYMGSEFENKN